MAEGAPRGPCRGRERAGGKGLPASPVLCQGQSCGPGGGPGQAEVGLQLSRAWPAWDQDRVAPSHLAQGRPRREMRGWVQCGAGTRARRARLSAGSRAQRLKPEGPVTWASIGPGKVSREAAAAPSGDGRPPGWRPALWVRRPEDGPGARRASPGGCAARPPVRGAGSPRRAGAAGRWGPGRPCWASAPHPGRAWRGRPGPASARSLARRPRLASSRRPGDTTAAPDPAPPRQWRQRRRRWRGGRAGGGAEPGRGVGPRAPSPPAAMATAARARRGLAAALPGAGGQCARRGEAGPASVPRASGRAVGKAGLAAAPSAACRGRPSPA